MVQMEGMQSIIVIWPALHPCRTDQSGLRVLADVPVVPTALTAGPRSILSDGKSDLDDAPIFFSSFGIGPLRAAIANGYAPILDGYESVTDLNVI